MENFRYIHRVAREADIAGDPQAVALHALWLSLCQGDGPPPIAALDTQALAWCKDDISIMLPLPEKGIFHFAHHGRNIVAASNLKVEGLSTRHLPAHLCAFYSTTHTRALELGVPIYCLNESRLSAPVHSWRRIVFPFGGRAGEASCLVGLLKPHVMQHQIWQSLSSNTGFAGGSLEPIYDHKDSIVDFLIIEAAGFADALGGRSPTTLNQLVGQLPPETIASILVAKEGERAFSAAFRKTIKDKPHAFEAEIWQSPYGLVLTLQDVSQVHSAQTMLEKRTKELRLTQQIGKIGGWRMPLDGSTVWWSPEMYDLLRLTPGLFTPTTRAVWDLYSRDDARRTGEVQKSVLQSGKPASLDVAARRGDGTTGHFTIEISLERDEGNTVIGFVGTIQDITRRKEAEISLEKLAYFDPLTSLPNRAMFKKELEAKVQSALVSRRPFFLMLMDLDKFKDVNDTLGHGAGDALLVRVARLLRELVPADALVARLGGDEFAILFQPHSEGASIEELAGTIVQNLTDAFLLDEGEVHIGISIGISEGLKDGTDSVALLKNADLALYSAKDNGRARYHFYKNIMSDLAEERLSLSRELKKALAEDKLELHYQPLVELASRKVIGFEALLRWNHPTRGYIPPAEFIPIAESSSLICDLGFWAMSRACRTLKQWQDAGNRPVSMSVNVSAVQFWQSSFETEVKDIVRSSGIDPALLTLEVTEGIFLDKSNLRVRTCFDELAKLGVNLAIDDFGTGFSSLGYLSELPFTKLKIDRTFITGIDKSHDKHKLLQGIIGLARGLGMTTVVEGAETQEEILVLQLLGCNIVQGFYFARPQPFEAWGQMIADIEGTSMVVQPEALAISA